MSNVRSRKSPLVSVAASVCLSLTLMACTHGPQSAARKPLAVDAAASSLSFVSTKAGTAGVGGVVEVHRFERFQGGLDADGNVRLDIELASVNTGVGIRDERLRTMLFNVAASPKASFTAKINPATIAALVPNATIDLDVPGTLSLAGQTRSTPAQLRVTRLSASSLQVATRSPIVVDAQQFGLKPGVEALREVMGLAFLAAASPVSLNMVLREQP